MFQITLTASAFSIRTAFSRKTQIHFLRNECVRRNASPMTEKHKYTGTNFSRNKNPIFQLTL
jgi:hypothetical protein